MLSVEGQRSRPSTEIRFDLLKVVGSSPARRASPDAVSSFRSARRSIADQMRACDSTRPLRADPRPAIQPEQEYYLFGLCPPFRL
ncbi:MAG: hypothetical protein WDM84_01535 [Bauldia sp.]